MEAGAALNSIIIAFAAVSVGASPSVTLHDALACCRPSVPNVYSYL